MGRGWVCGPCLKGRQGAGLLVAEWGWPAGVTPRLGAPEVAVRSVAGDPQEEKAGGHTGRRQKQGPSAPPRWGRGGGQGRHRSGSCEVGHWAGSTGRLRRHWEMPGDGLQAWVLTTDVKDLCRGAAGASQSRAPSKWGPGRSGYPPPSLGACGILSRSGRAGPLTRAGRDVAASRSHTGAASRVPSPAARGPGTFLCFRTYRSVTRGRGPWLGTLFP